MNWLHTDVQTVRDLRLHEKGFENQKIPLGGLLGPRAAVKYSSVKL